MAGLDHLVHCVASFDAFRTTMAQVGFTLTPPAEHPFGTGNFLVQLDGFFLEFLYVPNPHLIKPAADGEFSFGHFNSTFMQDGQQGVSMLVFESADARAERERYAVAGLTTYAPFDFSRTATMPGGEQVTVGFSLSFVTHPDMPRAVFFCCQQHAPEYFWRPEYQRHPNTAVSIGEVALVAREPLRYADFLRQVSNGEVTQSDTAAVKIVTPRGALAVYDPAGFEEAYSFEAPSLEQGPVFGGYRIEVANREVALNHLETAGVSWRRTASGHSIGPDDAAGAVIAFSEVF
jgi:hypothetical protein